MEGHVSSCSYPICREKRRHLERLLKVRKDMKAMVGRISCTVNGKERGELEECESDDMEMSCDQERVW